MLAFVEGPVVMAGPHHVVVNVQGLGFRIGIPSSTAAHVPDVGEVIRLHTHLQVREDGMSLFGFATEEEYELFVMLLSVAGIGPKGALSILSHASTSQIYLWLLNEDVPQLKKIPGIGNKTAQRLILELKGKIGGVARSVTYSPTPPTFGGGDLHHQAAEALCSLGYDGDEAAQAVAEVIRQAPAADLETIVKGALKLLARL